MMNPSTLRLSHGDEDDKDHKRLKVHRDIRIEDGSGDPLERLLQAAAEFVGRDTSCIDLFYIDNDCCVVAIQGKMELIDAIEECAGDILEVRVRTKPSFFRLSFYDGSSAPMQEFFPSERVLCGGDSDHSKYSNLKNLVDVCFGEEVDGAPLKMWHCISAPTACGGEENNEVSGELELCNDEALSVALSLCKSDVFCVKVCVAAPSAKKEQRLQIYACSAGNRSETNVAWGTAGISVNGWTSINIVTRGLNVVAVDPKTLKVVLAASFDTYADAKASDRFVDAVDALAQGTVVAIAVKDEATTQLSLVAKTTICSLAGSTAITSLAYGGSYALVGCKGGPQGSAKEALSNSSACCVTFVG